MRPKSRINVFNTDFRTQKVGEITYVTEPEWRFSPTLQLLAQ